MERCNHIYEEYPDGRICFECDHKPDTNQQKHMAYLPKHVFDQKDADKKAEEALAESLKRSLTMFTLRMPDGTLYRDDMNRPVLRNYIITRKEQAELGAPKDARAIQVTLNWSAALC